MNFCLNKLLISVPAALGLLSDGPERHLMKINCLFILLIHLNKFLCKKKIILLIFGSATEKRSLKKSIKV
jgi:hypothetical protein